MKKRLDEQRAKGSLLLETSDQTQSFEQYQATQIISRSLLNRFKRKRREKALKAKKTRRSSAFKSFTDGVRTGFSRVGRSMFGGRSSNARASRAKRRAAKAADAGDDCRGTALGDPVDLDGDDAAAARDARERKKSSFVGRASAFVSRASEVVARTTGFGRTPRRTLMSSLRASLRSALGDGAAAASAPAADAAAPAADAAPAAKSAAVELAEEMELRRNECVVCLDAARDATIIHGDTGHMCCCYDCALDLKWRGDPCPMCRLPIDAVIRQYFS